MKNTATEVFVQHTMLRIITLYLSTKLTEAVPKRRTDLLWRCPLGLVEQGNTPVTAAKVIVGAQRFIPAVSASGYRIERYHPAFE